jgi:hypothetical protein
MTLNIQDDITQNFNAHDVIGTFLMTLNKNQTLRVALSKNYTFVMTLNKNLSIQDDITQNFNAHDVIGTFLMTLNGIH